MRASASRIWWAQPDHSCPTVNGTASCRCVRPVLTTSIHSLALVSMAAASASACGSRCSSNSSTAAMYIAVGKVSFDDCPILTLSFGCTGDLLPILPPSSWTARFDSTSLTFMFDCVPDPVCRSEEHTSELQSRRDLVCRLLLEKKKNTRERVFSRSTTERVPQT